MSEENGPIAPSPDVVSREISGETVLLNLESGVYFGLNEVGGFVWSLIEEKPRSVAELADAVADAFDVGAQEARNDLGALVERLRANDLLQAG